MAKKTYLESGLRFTFPRDWTVVKYDEHRFYQYVSGSGLKGVDFIAIHNDQLVLIEVKNYAMRFAQQDHVPMDVLLADRETQLKKYLRKFKDTFRLLDVIEQYYHRQWWYRNVFCVFKSYFSKSFILGQETGFWSEAIALLDQPEKVRLVLWLELAPEFESEKAKVLNAYFQEKIQPKMPEGMSFIIAYSDQPYDGIMGEIDSK